MIAHSGIQWHSTQHKQVYINNRMGKNKKMNEQAKQLLLLRWIFIMG